ETLESRQVLGSRDDQDLPHPAQHQGRERVVDHRLVIDGKQLLADRAGDRMQTSTRAAGQNDALPPDGARVRHAPSSGGSGTRRPARAEMEVAMRIASEWSPSRPSVSGAASPRSALITLS